jgi:hypothetical protein
MSPPHIKCLLLWNVFCYSTHTESRTNVISFNQSSYCHWPCHSASATNYRHEKPFLRALHGGPAEMLWESANKQNKRYKCRNPCQLLGGRYLGAPRLCTILVSSKLHRRLLRLRRGLGLRRSCLGYILFVRPCTRGNVQHT